MIEKPPKPTIMVYVPTSFSNQPILQEILNGIEEESVFYEVKSVEPNNAVSLAYEAAGTSVLEVGIGIDNSGAVALHYRKMETPLFTLQPSNGKEAQRRLGTNGARLVRGIPFAM
jgi:hypothetical protein